MERKEMRKFDKMFESIRLETMFLFIHIVSGNWWLYSFNNEKEINQSFMRERYFHINYFIMNINIFKCL